ncbi:MAG: aminotransferase class I/II-fold pyridoxal phosphate-dependent enzyme [Kangiellaceae bacterium]|nr:aminotransferase class I/II-fold pyridoxal phosphate-dependent enzyme [Kangiellaceae bacterium]
MKLDKNEWNDLDRYFRVFESITRRFMGKLEHDKVAKLDVSLAVKNLPVAGLSLLDTVDHLRTNVIPQLSAARGSRYWGFVTGGATPVSTLGDWLVSTFDQNVAKEGDSVASEIEWQTIGWLCELFDLPQTFRGIMTTGATAANFLGACVARQYAGNQQGIDVAKDGVYGLDVEIFSTTPHASMVKSLGMSGLGQRHITRVCPLDNSEAMDVTHLRELLEKSDKRSKIVIASAGTVTATDFDDLVTISELCKEHNAWLHVDGAFGLFERLISGVNGKTKGIELADSITVDCHKWLNVPYDSGVFLTRHLDLLEDSFDVPAPYLVNTGNQPSFMSIGVENSRRFRAFPVWLSLLAYGKNGVKRWIESNIEHAKKLADWIDQSNDYELVHPCRMNIVLFRPNCSGLSSAAADKLTANRMLAINKDGRVFLSPGEWQGDKIIRAALSNWQTDQSDIEIAIQVLKDLARQ